MQLIRGPLFLSEGDIATRLAWVQSWLTLTLIPKILPIFIYLVYIGTYSTSYYLYSTKRTTHPYGEYTFLYRMNCMHLRCLEPNVVPLPLAMPRYLLLDTLIRKTLHYAPGDAKPFDRGCNSSTRKPRFYWLSLTTWRISCTMSYMFTWSTRLRSFGKVVPVESSNASSDDCL